MDSDRRLPTGLTRTGIDTFIASKRRAFEDEVDAELGAKKELTK
jgi:hypothetical protein